MKKYFKVGIERQMKQFFFFILRGAVFLYITTIFSCVNPQVAVAKNKFNICTFLFKIYV